MSVMVQVEYQYRQHGRKTFHTGSDLVSVPENTERAILSVLRLLHPHWEALKVISASLVTPPEVTPEA